MRQEPGYPGNIERAQKQREWERTLAALDTFADLRGKPIENDIKETVAGLQVHGFPTVGSCEGHADRGLPYPWVDVEEENEPTYRWENEENMRLSLMAELRISADEINRASQMYDETKEDLLDEAFYAQLPHDAHETAEFVEWSKRNLALAARLQELVEKFYAQTEQPADAPKITVRRIGASGSRLIVDDESRESDEKMVRQSSSADDARTADAGITARMRRRQDAMFNFAAFLKREFLSAQN